MTAEQMIAIGGLTVLGLIGIVGWFLRKMIHDLEQSLLESNKKVAVLSDQFNSWRVTVEQNFVSFDTFETMRAETRSSLREIYAEQSKASQILARLDERSQLGERIGQLIDALSKGKK